MIDHNHKDDPRLRIDGSCNLCNAMILICDYAIKYPSSLIGNAFSEYFTVKVNYEIEKDLEK